MPSPLIWNAIQVQKRSSSSHLVSSHLISPGLVNDGDNISNSTIISTLKAHPTRSSSDLLRPLSGCGCWPIFQSFRRVFAWPHNSRDTDDLPGLNSVHNWNGNYLWFCTLLRSNHAKLYLTSIVVVNSSSSSRKRNRIRTRNRQWWQC